MTKKNLNWRFKNLPTVNEVSMLVDNKIISAEEAKELLFNDKESQDVEAKALKEQVEFLEGVIDRLTRNRSGWSWSFPIHYPIGSWSINTTSGALGQLYSAANTSKSGSITINSSSLVN